MPGRVLSEEGYAGLWGKLPRSGDFVGRGLSDDFRARWDAWITRHLARRDGPWPPGGIRFRLASGARTATGLVIESRDAAGRRFPLSALLVLPFAPEPAGADRWAERALPLLRAAASGDLAADALWEGLDALERPVGRDPAPTAALLLWTPGRTPVAAEPESPDAALDILINSRGSSTP